MSTQNNNKCNIFTPTEGLNFVKGDQTAETVAELIKTSLNCTVQDVKTISYQQLADDQEYKEIKYRIDIDIQKDKRNDLKILIFPAKSSAYNKGRDIQDRDVFFIKNGDRICMITKSLALDKSLRESYLKIKMKQNEPNAQIVGDDFVIAGHADDTVIFKIPWKNEWGEGLPVPDNVQGFNTLYNKIQREQQNQTQPTIPQIAVPKINIWLNFVNGERSVFPIDANATIHDLIQKIKKKMGQDGDIKIWHNAQELEDNDQRTLKQCGIRDNACLTVDVKQNLIKAQQHDNTNLLNKQTKIVPPYDFNSIKTSTPTKILSQTGPQKALQGVNKQQNSNYPHPSKIYQKSLYSNSRKSNLYSHYQNFRKSNLKTSCIPRSTLKASHIQNSYNNTGISSKRSNNYQFSYYSQLKPVVRPACQPRSPSQIITSKRNITNTNQPSFKNTSQSKASAVPTQSIIVPKNYLEAIREKYPNTSVSPSQVAPMKESVDKPVVYSGDPLQQSGVPLQKENRIVVRSAKIEKVKVPEAYLFDSKVGDGRIVYKPATTNMLYHLNGKQIYACSDGYGFFMYSNKPIYEGHGGGLITAGKAKYCYGNYNPSIYNDPNVSFCS